MAAGKKTCRTEYDSLMDAFCKKHPESAILYLNYLMRYADDEGFVPSFSIALSNGYAIDNLRDLEKAGLIVTPEPKTGISAIVYWNIISDIKPCRKKETIFQYEKSLLVLTDKNAYKKRVQKCTDKSSVQNGVQKCVQNCTQNDDAELTEQSETADKSVVFESGADSSRANAYIEPSKTIIDSNNGFITDHTLTQSNIPNQSKHTQSFGATFSVDQKIGEKDRDNVPTDVPEDVPTDSSDNPVSVGTEYVCPLFAPKGGSPMSESRRLFLSLPPEQQKWFEMFWKAYPKKVDAPPAIRAWKKARVNAVLFDRIMKAIERESLSDKWLRGVYKNPATWLNACCWENEMEPEPQKQSKFTGNTFTGNTVKRKTPEEKEALLRSYDEMTERAYERLLREQYGDDSEQ